MARAPRVKSLAQPDDAAKVKKSRALHGQQSATSEDYSPRNAVVFTHRPHLDELSVRRSEIPAWTAIRLVPEP